MNDVTSLFKIEKVKSERFGESVSGAVSIIQKHISPELDFTKGEEIDTKTRNIICGTTVTVEKDGFEYRMALEVPFKFSFTVFKIIMVDGKKTYLDVYHIVNNLGKISGKFEGSYINSPEFIEFDLELTEYLFNWKKNVWDAPIT